MFNKEWKYLFLITVVFIAACIETDIYLPAFADMILYFNISEEKIQSLLTWNFIGICISGPFYGPISDSIGRKKPLLMALLLFLVGSLLTLFSASFEVMLVGRILQGLGSGGCFTLGTAIIFDAFQEQKAIEAINKLNSTIPLIMALAPMLGGYLNAVYGFRSNFIAIAVIVLVSLLISVFFFGETLPETKRVPLNRKKILADFRKVFTSVPFWQTTLIISLIFAGYLAFLSMISVLFVVEYGVDKTYIPFFQASLLGAWVIASLLFNRVMAKIGGTQIKAIGTVLIAVGGVGLAVTTWLVPMNAILLTLPMVIFTYGANWTMGLYFPEGMDIFPDIKGVTASLLTSARLLITAIIVGLASAFYDSTIYPITIIISCIVVSTLGLIIFYERAQKKPEMVLEGVVE